MIDARIWNELSKRKPGGHEPVLCLLDNGQQVTLAFDEDNNEWAFYDENSLKDANVVAWRKLESIEEIKDQLGFI
jgi:hypothetical protein